MVGVDDNMRLRCMVCGEAYKADPMLFRCPRCGGLLEIEYTRLPGVLATSGVGVWRYSPLLPRSSTRITLGEGLTPLVDVPGAPGVYVKFEGANPTGSFKDRGMAVAVSLAKEAGARVVLAASTGNTSASASAYARRAGLEPVIVLPRGRIARGKLFQAVLHGATVVEVEGSFDDALAAVMRFSREAGGVVYPVNSFNQWRLEGQKTLAYEVVEQLGYAPDYVFVPVGNAGNIYAIWRGFKDMYAMGIIDELPVMIGVQAAGAAPLARMLAKGLQEPDWIDKPETVATAIRIGKPVNWMRALKAVRESGGTIIEVSDREILGAQLRLARKTGLGVEPASAASMAGYLRLRDKIPRGSETVLVATGHALKDPDVPLEFKPLRAGSPGEAVAILREVVERRRGLGEEVEA